MHRSIAKKQTLADVVDVLMICLGGKIFQPKLRFQGMKDFNHNASERKDIRFSIPAFRLGDFWSTVAVRKFLSCSISCGSAIVIACVKRDAEIRVHDLSPVNEDILRLDILVSNRSLVDKH